MAAWPLLVPISVEIAGGAVLLGLIFSPIASVFAFKRGSWQVMTLAAGLSLPAAFLAHLPYAALLLLPCAQLAVALALRWRVSIAGWLVLLVVAVAVWFVGGAGEIVLGSAAHSQFPLVWVLIVGLLLGFAALGFAQPPWASGSARVR